MRKTVLAIVLVLAASTAHADLGRAVSENGADDVFLSETINPDVSGGWYTYDGNAMLDTWTALPSMYGITHQGNPGNPILDQMLDTSLSGPDTVGIIKSGDTGRFFGVVYPYGYTTDQSAEWVFDIAGGGVVDVSVDFAAMGDFVTSGSWAFEYSIDGAPFAPLYTLTGDGSRTQTYTLEDGSVIDIDDPMTVDGVSLDNNFQTFTSGALGSGNELTLKFSTTYEWSYDPFAFRNVVVVPEPVTLTMAAPVGLFILGRRR